MSTVNPEAIAQRLTRGRLTSYLQATGEDLSAALELYDWNASVSGALHEDIGRLEVVFRNAIDEALVAYGEAKGWPAVWYRRTELFPGRHGARALGDLNKARNRAGRRGRPEVHGKVIAELSLGFWRYLCTPAYLTSMWVPALTQAFPEHPGVDDPRDVREGVSDRIQRIHFLRNRVAHYEPIHQRDLDHDVRSIEELAGWICPDTRSWVVGLSRTRDLIAERPWPSG